MRTKHVTGALAGAVVSLVSLAVLERDAAACGGCFTPPPPPSETESVITDEKMILSVSMNQTTLYDQINYSGNPASFAWVLPIKGTVTVGLSADVMFQVVNQLTATVVQSPPTNCPPAPTCNNYFGAGAPAASFAEADDAGAAAPAVTVTSQAQVGPYETVQLHSTDGSALTTWLTQHGYQIPDSTKPIINAYVSQQFDFLALKLVPGEGVQSMQPVRVTSTGAAPTLPLHMVAIGTGPVTGITIWVIADGRWQPSNFPTFTIPDSQIAWDWATSSSNYETLRTTAEAQYAGRGWQIESSLELSQYSIQQSLVSGAEYDTTGGYLAATGGPDGGTADGGAPDSAAPDAGGGNGSDNGSGSGDDGYDAGAQANAAAADLAVLFAGIAAPNVRITRMRSDVAQSALSADMILQASSDQSELTNIHTAQQEIGEPQCAVYSAVTCAQVGTEPRSQALAAAAASGLDGGGCSTTPPRARTETAVALLFAFAGFLGLRLRHKRR